MMGKLHFAAKFSHCKYRMFLRRYCIWRKDYTRSVLSKASRPDTHNMRSRNAIIIQKNRWNCAVWLFRKSISNSDNSHYALSATFSELQTFVACFVLFLFFELPRGSIAMFVRFFIY